MRTLLLIFLVGGCVQQQQAVVNPRPDLAQPPAEVDMAMVQAPGDLAQPQSRGDLAQPAASQPDLAGLTAVEVSGLIDADATWSGLYRITAELVIASARTITVAAGTVVQVAPDVSIYIDGTLKVVGTTAAPVYWLPSTTGMRWNGLTVRGGGSIDLANASVDFAKAPLLCDVGAAKCVADRTSFTNYTGYGIALRANATFTRIRVENGGSDGIYCNTAGVVASVTDSLLHATGGDAIWFEQGTLTLEHNTVYGNVVGGANADQHCAVHVAGPGTFTVQHNDFYRSVYGLQASAMGSSSLMSGNNFFENGTSWGAATAAGGGPDGVNPAVQLGGNYWGGQVPTVQGNSTVSPSNPSTYVTSKIAGTGPR